MQVTEEEASETIFELTESHLNTGLRGIPVGTCRTSFVDPHKGVHYVGYPVGDLADMDPADIIYMLFEKRLPNRQEAQDFRNEMIGRAEDMPTGALRVLEALTPYEGSAVRRDWRGWHMARVRARNAAKGLVGDPRRPLHGKRTRRCREASRRPVSPCGERPVPP